MCWLTSAPAVISNCALRCRRSRNSSTRSRLECATAKSGGNRNGPPGRLTHAGIGLRRLPQRAFVPDRAGEPGIARDQFGIVGQHPQADARVRAVDRAADVAGIKQLRPSAGRERARSFRARPPAPRRNVSGRARMQSHALAQCMIARRAGAVARDEMSSSLRPATAGSALRNRAIAAGSRLR